MSEVQPRNRPIGCPFPLILAGIRKKGKENAPKNASAFLMSLRSFASSSSSLRLSLQWPSTGWGGKQALQGWRKIIDLSDETGPTERGDLRSKSTVQLENKKNQRSASHGLQLDSLPRRSPDLALHQSSLLLLSTLSIRLLRARLRARPQDELLGSMLGTRSLGLTRPKRCGQKPWAQLLLGLRPCDTHR